ncbi:hypothetical protein CQA49_01070 [Helicobacter sp. MIT 00-7814]|uniref:hypothetical protein n=1 Tax=unclassified Helicobacter TaxID=2593540 RepID=UPI000E1E99EA|nr:MULTISPECIES: hypothetical protein [unclassified Helicobacter]RDU55100.1 hypothetical protein CQA37_04660 [Helicobacter sp. MIT 99-10781]RDU56919.1 hypothetical protein CQA49_01070 [Helicobacter sp. MIT 00-7814]
MKKKVAFGLIGTGAVVVIALLVIVFVLSKKMNANLEKQINHFLQEKVASADSEILSFEPFVCSGKTEIACKSKAIVFGAPDLLGIEEDTQSKQTQAESWRFEDIELDLSGRDSQANASAQFLARNSEIAFKITCDASLDSESKNAVRAGIECYGKNEEFAYNGFAKAHFSLTHKDFTGKIQDALAILLDINKEGDKSADDGKDGEEKRNALGVRLDSLAINERANDLFSVYKKALGAENEGMLEGMLFGFVLFSHMLQNELQEQSDEEIKEFESALLNALESVLSAFDGGNALNIEVAKKADYEPILLPEIEERITLEWLAKHYAIDSSAQTLENNAE